MKCREQATFLLSDRNAPTHKRLEEHVLSFNERVFRSRRKAFYVTVLRFPRTND